MVPTRNRAGYLANLLAAVDAQDHPCFEVLVVDDASTDSTSELLSAWEGPTHRVIRMPRSEGSYAARNAGWQEARGDIIAFTDDDCLPRPDWLTRLESALEDPALLAVQGTTVTDHSRRTPFTNQIEQITGGAPYRTCNIAYRRPVLERLGGFDASLRWYADNILGLQVAGTVGFAPGAVVEHPPRQRDWRDRQTWLARFQADAIHRRELRRLGVERHQPPGAFLPLVLWVVRPLIKQSGRHALYLLRHPRLYAAGIRPVIREKVAMLQALRDFWTQPSAGSERLRDLPAKPVISVVIVTNRRPAMLRDLLSELKRQSRVPDEVIVVDHAADEDTRSVVLDAAAIYVAAPNVTLGAARQAGVDAANGDVIAFTDDDCLPSERWLEMLLAAFRDRPESWGVQGVTRREKGEIGAHGVSVSRPDRLYRTCNIAYRQDALDRAAGFDVGFHGWFEDTAFGAKVLVHGPISFAPEALVTHRAMAPSCLGRSDWKTLLSDERRLASSYPSFYRKVRGPNVTTVLLGRWLLGSPLKTLARELPRAPRHPIAYLRLVRRIFAERRALIEAWRD
ncbi:MAG: glycosyltransferase family 2 protein [Chloroflexota bacterium]